MGGVAEREEPRRLDFHRADLASAWGLATQTAPHQARAPETPSAPEGAQRPPPDVATQPDAAPEQKRTKRARAATLRDRHLPRWVKPVGVLAAFTFAANVVTQRIVVAAACALIGGIVLWWSLALRDGRRTARTRMGVHLAASLGVTTLLATLLSAVLPSNGHAAAPESAVPRSDPLANLVQLRCTSNGTTAYFLGSLTNRADGSSPFRIDVTFTGADGRQVGQASQRLDGVVRQSPTSVEVVAAVTGDVSTCHPIAIRLPRDG